MRTVLLDTKRERWQTKSNRILICAAMMGVLAAPQSHAQDGATKVSFVITKSTLYCEQGDKGWVIPKNRIHIQPDYGLEYGIVAPSRNNNGTEGVFGLAAQEVGTPMSPDTRATRDVLLKCFVGLPFSMRSLDSDPVSLSAPLDVTIVGQGGAIKPGTRKVTVPEGMPVVGNKKEKVANGVESSRLLAWRLTKNEWGITLDYLGAARGDSITFEAGGRIDNAGLIRETYLETDVVIEVGQQPLVHVSDESLLPVECNDKGIPIRLAPSAIGIRWVFPKAGMTVRGAEGQMV